MRIKTDKGFLDLYNGFNYSFNYSVQDLTDITKRKTSFSRDIKIPATSKNLVIFGLADLLDVEFTNFEPLEKLNCEVISDSSVVFKGFIQLDSVDFNGVEKSINIILYSNTINLIDRIKGVKLNELDWSEYNHKYEVTTNGDVFKSIEGKIRYYGNLVDRKEGSGYIYPTINYGSYNEDDNLLLANDIRPAVFLKEYIDKIFLFAGVPYKSDLFQTKYFQNLIIPCTSEFKLSEEEAEERKVEVNNSVNQTFTYLRLDSVLINRYDESLLEYDTEVVDVLNQFNTTTNELTIANSGKYKISYSGSIDFNSNIVDNGLFVSIDSIKVDVKVFVNGLIYDTNEVVLDNPTPLNVSSNIGNYNTNFDFVGDVTKEFQENDVVTIKYYYPKYLYRYNFGTDAIYPETEVVFSNNYLLCEYSEDNETIQFGDTFQFSNAIPSIDADKFLKSIITTFNLYILEDADGVLKIETRDSFYNSKNTIDFNGKLDLQKAYNIEIASKDIPRYYGFKYSNEEESFLIETNNQFNETIFDYSTEFESSQMYRTKYGFELPVLEDAKLRILFNEGVGSELVNYGTISNEAPVSNSSVFMRVNGYPEFSLKYGDNDVYFDLYNLFYSNTINDLKSKDSKVFQGYFKLDFNSISLRDRVYFRGAYWRILKIENFNPESVESTKVVLFKLDGDANYLTPEEKIENVFVNNGIFTEEFNNIFA